MLRFEIGESIFPRRATQKADLWIEVVKDRFVRVAVLRPSSDHAMAANVRFDGLHCSIVDDW
jgi:hypothetical protein